MHFKSKAQIDKFIELHKTGKIGLETLATWAMRTEDIKNLPQHARDNQVPVRNPVREELRDGDANI